MKAIFKDIDLQKQFEQNGYVILPFLNTEEVERLKDIYTEKFSNKQVTGLYPSHSRNDYDLTIEVSNQIIDIFKHRANEILYNYKIFFGHFMVKSNVDSQEFELHQDWSIVEESKYNVAQMWCPLVDTSKENGGMFLIPGSHHFFSNFRSGSLFRFHIKLSERTQTYIVPLKIKAGDILLYHNRLIHGSFPNQSNQPRLVAMGNATEIEAEYIYYQKSTKAPNLLDTYRLDREVFLKNLNVFEKGGVPAEFELLNTISYNDNPIAESDILLHLEKRNGSSGFLKKLNRLFIKKTD